MSWAAVAGAAVGVVGSAMGGDEEQTQTSQQMLDPRIAGYLYGGDNGGGLLNGVNALWQQQAGQGGLNPMQNAGLEMQRQTLMDPRYTQGFDQMRNLGGGLMNQGVAGNPFMGAQRATAQPMHNMQAPMQPGRMQSLGIPSAASTPISQMTAAPPPMLLNQAPRPAPANSLWDDELLRQQNHQSAGA